MMRFYSCYWMCVRTVLQVSASADEDSGVGHNQEKEGGGGGYLCCVSCTRVHKYYNVRCIILCQDAHSLNYNSMKFQSSPPATTDQLAHLSRFLIRHHCIVSIPAIVLMFASFLIISIVIRSPCQLTSPEFILPHLLKLHFKYTVDYLEYFQGFASRLLELGVVGSLADSVGNYGGIQIGLTCLLGNTTECDRFAVLGDIAWQYKTNQHLHALINYLIICEKATMTCVATKCKKNLNSLELSLINSIKQSTNMSPSVRYINNSSYIITQNSKILIMAKLRPNTQIITKIINEISVSTVQYYQLQVVYPNQQVIAQYNPNQLAVDQIKIDREIVEINFKNGQLAVQFVIQASRTEQTFQYLTELSFVVSLIFIHFLVVTQRNSIQEWVRTNFSRITLVNKLYKYTIRDIFTGIKPSISNILQRGPNAELFKTLSELVDKSIVQIEQEEKVSINKEGFKFHSKINEIIEKYKVSIKGSMEAKNKYILANRFNLQTYINDLCQSESKTMRDYYLRAQELGILKEFFKFAYLSILKPREEFLFFLQEDHSALPTKLLEYFIKINQNIHQAETIYDKLDIFGEEQVQANNEANSNSPATNSNIEQVSYIEQNKQQLQFRYLTMLRQLDSKNNFAEQLGLDHELRSLTEIVDNTRYLLARHNKSIRNYCK